MNPRERDKALWLMLGGLCLIAVIFGSVTRWVDSRRPKLMNPVSNAKQVTMALRLYAMDFDGNFPTYPPEQRETKARMYRTSTEAFNDLIVETGIDTDEIFCPWPPPPHKVKPNGDGFLTAGENSLSYVLGLKDTAPKGTPVIADEMIAPGFYGKDHPWLKARRAIVGYVGGHVRIERLSSKKPGATIPGPKGSGMTNIFQQIDLDEHGVNRGGLLPVPASNIVNP